MPLQLQFHTTATQKGRRPYQEDRLVSISTPEGLCLAVFDGHGGDECSHTVSELLPRLLTDAMTPDVPVPDVLKTIFERLNAATVGMYAGSTASIVFIPWSADLVHVAVLGDSPVIVKRGDGTIWIAPEHNVRTNKAEAKAAQGRGGFISGGYLLSSYHGPGLQMSRALGDVELHKVLDRTPDISTQVMGEGSFVLVCTDGALDPGHMNEEKAAQEVVKLVESGGDAQAVVNRAIAIPTDDNVTSLLVRVEVKSDV